MGSKERKPPQSPASSTISMYVRARACFDSGRVSELSGEGRIRKGRRRGGGGGQRGEAGTEECITAALTRNKECVWNGEQRTETPSGPGPLYNLNVNVRARCFDSGDIVEIHKPSESVTCVAS